MVAKQKEIVLYVDDDPTNLSLFEMVFRDKYEVITTVHATEAFKVMESNEVQVVLVDYYMPEISGLEFISKASIMYPETVYMIITAYTDLNFPVGSVNQINVFRFFLKPWREFDLDQAIQQALNTYRLRQENRGLLVDLKNKNRELSLLKEKLVEENLYFREEIKLNADFENIITGNVGFRKVLKQIEQVSVTQATVLIMGETGTGKELVARAVHSLSDRNEKPFIKINCASIPESLLESELFGHVKGAFTGSVANRKGRFELAHTGTLFLDEIGELPLALQPKLLRVLQDGEFEPVGGAKSIKVDVRIIAATNRELEKEVQKGNFRRDLFYRLHVFPITVPPLRERKDDIPLLVNHFLKKFNKLNGKNILAVPKETMTQFESYQWPGNIRELENIIERAVIISTGSKLRLGYRLSGSLPDESIDEAFVSLEEMEKQYILKILEQTHWRISGEKGAARILEMKPTTLNSRMKKLGIARP